MSHSCILKFNRFFGSKTIFSDFIDLCIHQLNFVSLTVGNSYGIDFQYFKKMWYGAY